MADKAAIQPIASTLIIRVTPPSGFAGGRIAPLQRAQ
jgi:hypothetical protein